jgi:hypothetical protein
MGGEKTRGVFKGIGTSRWAGSTVMTWIALGVGGQGAETLLPRGSHECVLRFARPGTGDEGGREKPRSFQCRSKLSKLSNHY